MDTFLTVFPVINRYHIPKSNFVLTKGDTTNRMPINNTNVQNQNL